MKSFGEQAYFVNVPSRFISKDGKTMWLLYSGNFATNRNDNTINENPPGSHYGLVMQKIKLLSANDKVNKKYMLVSKPCFAPVSIPKSITFRERKVKIKLMNDNPAQPYPASAKRPGEETAGEKRQK